MAGPDMGEKLLAAGDLEAADAVPERAASVAALIRRERIRVRLFAAFTIFLWVAVACALFFTVYAFFVFFFPKVAEVAYQTESRVGWEEIIGHLPLATVCATATLSCLVVLAAVCTVAFVMVSRQATLHQIQISLREITDQLKKDAEENSASPISKR